MPYTPPTSPNVNFTFTTASYTAPSGSAVTFDMGSGGGPPTIVHPGTGAWTWFGQPPVRTLNFPFPAPGHWTWSGFTPRISATISPLHITTLKRAILRDSPGPTRATSFLRLVLRDQSNVPSQTRVTSFVRLVLRDQSSVPSQMRVTNFIRLILRSQTSLPSQMRVTRAVRLTLRSGANAVTRRPHLLFAMVS